MNCYVCTAQGTVRAAIGICTYCGTGLCATHRNELPGPGGTSIGCRHRQPDEERSAS